jgi:hypothetical protein
MTKVRESLFGSDPYLDFDPSKYPTDFQGWGSNHQFFEKILAALRPAIIIEVGTWKGGSAIHMANLSRQFGFDTEIICVDTWLGSPEHVLDRWQGWRNSLNYVNGYPSLYYTFLSNVVANGLQEIITPFPIASESAAVVLSALNVKADVIYIDAAHEYEPAFRDMRAFWPLLSDHGMMICDDYSYSDVTSAACSFAASVDRPLYASWGKAVISKKKGRKMIFTLDAIET